MKRDSVSVRSMARKRGSVARQALRVLAETLEERRMLNSLPLGAGINLAEIGTDVQSSLNDAETSLSPILDHPLPIIGNKLGDAVTTLNNLATQFANALSNGQNQISFVETQLANALGTSGGLGILPLLNGQFNPADEVSTPNADNTEIDQVEFKLPLGQSAQVVNSSLAFSTGLPGLGLTTSGNIVVSVGYKFQLDFGYNNSQGFFVDTTPGTGTSLTLNANLNLPGGTVSGTLGPLNLNVKDHVNDDGFNGTSNDSYGSTNFNASFGIAFTNKDTTSPNFLPFNEIPSDLGLSVNLSGDAQINLDAVVSFGGNPEFPSLSTMFHLDWPFSDQLVGTNDSMSNFGDEPTVGFEDVSLDLGSFFNNLVGPVISDLQNVLHPIEPFIAFLNKPAPLFNDLGPLQTLLGFGSGTVTMLDVANVLSHGSSSVLQYVDDFNTINNFITEFQPSAIGGGYMLDLGSFGFGNPSGGSGIDSAINPETLSSLSSINVSDLNLQDASSLQGIENEAQKLGQQIGGAAGGKVVSFLSSIVNDFSSQLGDEGGDDDDDGEGDDNDGFGATGGIDFPIIDDPESAFGLLLGQNVNLFTFAMPTLSLKLSLDQTFGLGPLGVTVQGDLDSDDDFFTATANLSGGYDTKGLTEWAGDGFDINDIGDLANGFYLNTGLNTSLVVNLGLEAYGGINAYVASAGVGGGINGGFTFELNDPSGTGQVRLSDLENEGLANIFSVNGEVDASFFAFAQIGFSTPFGFVGTQFKDNIASTVLFSVNSSQTNPTPDPTSLSLAPLSNLTIANQYQSYTATVSTGDGQQPFGSVTFTLTGPLQETVTETLVGGQATLPDVLYPTIGEETIVASFSDSTSEFGTSTSTLYGVVRGTIYVDQNVQGGNDDGTSWQNAYGSLWQAVSLSLPGDTIDVAQGTYISTEYTPFNLSQDCDIIGGFPTGGANVPIPSIYPTLLETDNTTELLTAYDLTSVTIDGFTIRGGRSTAPGTGGAVTLAGGSDPRFLNCIFTDNSAVDGGAVNDYDSSPTFVNCLFDNNIAHAGGAVYDQADSNPSFINCTFGNNTAAAGGGGAIDNTDGSTSKVTNSILWGDTGSEIANDQTSSAVVTYSDIDQAGFTGFDERYAYDIDSDPFFVSSEGENYDLTNGSPCISHGNYNASAGIIYDLAGNDRSTPGGTVDMGAYEYQGPFIIYVDADASGLNNGTSWADAFDRLSSAVDVATAGYTIEVAVGTYIPGTVAGDSFPLTSGVTIQGGYENGGSFAPDPSLYAQTYLDGAGISSSVVTADEAGSTAKLIGFTITGGDGINGGGLSAFGSSPTIIDCTFTGNVASGNGGAVYDDNSSPTFVDCTFSDNSAGGSGGAISDQESSAPLIASCAFYGNTAQSKGGAIFNSNSSSPSITNCSFTQNQAMYGGAIDSTGTSRRTLTGAGVGLSEPIVTNCILWNDVSTLLPADAEIYGSADVTYSDVSGGYAGSQNLSADPLYTSNTDLQLQNGSPCIDQGDTLTSNEIENTTGIHTDLAGNPRSVDVTRLGPLASFVDMGAYQYQGATSLLFVGQSPLTIAAGSNFAHYIIVSLEQNGHPTTDDSSTVTLSIASGPAGAVLSGTVQSAVDVSLAKFTNLSISGPAGTYTLTATDGGDIPATSQSFTITTATYSTPELEFIQQPTNVEANATMSPAVTVGVYLNGSLDTADPHTTVTLSDGDTVIGTAEVDEGIATFADLVIPTTGTYTLTASDGTYTGRTSTSFTVSPPLARPILTFGAAPTNNMVGMDFSSPITVTQTQNGNPLSDGSTVTLQILSAPSEIITDGGGPVEATLSGSLTATVGSNGVATFTGLSANFDGAYLIEAYDGNDVISEMGFNVSQENGNVLLEFTQQPSNFQLGGNRAVPTFSVELEFPDGDNTGFSDEIAIQAVGASSSNWGGVTEMYLTNGVATFSSVYLGIAGQSVLEATDVTYPYEIAGYSNAFTAEAAPATKLVQASTPMETAGASFSLPVTAEDDIGNGNVATSYSGNQMFTLVGAPAGVATGATFDASFDAGMGLVSNIVEEVAGTYTLQAGDPNLGVPDVYFTIGAGAPSRLAFIQLPAVTTSGANISSDILVAVEDQFGNMVTDDSSPVTLSVASTGDGPLNGVVTVDALNGVATFDQVSTDAVGPLILMAQDQNDGISPTTSSSVTVAAPATIYVDQNAAGAGTGQDWADAYPDLQSALTTAIDGDTIDVAQGDYSPGSDPGDTFQLVNGITLQGGFDTGGFDGPSPVSYPTILDGMSNNYNVVTGDGTDSTAVLDGFTITGGNADGAEGGDTGFGGGLVIDGGSPTITDCIFTNNTAVSGGAVYVADQGASPAAFIDCTFDTNNATAYGGAAYIVDASPTFLNTLFVANSSGQSGGAVYNSGAAPTITNCTFTGNTAAAYGGAMENEDASAPILTNDIFWSDTDSNGNTDIADDKVDFSTSTPVINNTDMDFDTFVGTAAGNTGNIDDIDPLFVDPASSNYQLQADSPCINAGSNDAAALPGVATDLAGDPRIADEVVDMGAYEAQSVDVAWTGDGDGVSWNLPGNWSDNTVPTSTDSVIIGAGFTDIQLPAGSYAVGSLSASSPVEATSGATLTLYGPSYFADGLTIDSGGSVLLGGLSTGSQQLLIVAGLNVDSGGTLDLSNGAMIVQDGNLPAITAEIARGYDNGAWAGQGITSSAAQSDSTHLTALGVILNNDGNGNILYGIDGGLGLFDGYNPSISDVLIRYTYYGDANLDGKVDGSDYSRIDGGSLARLTGWYNGDFNYDGAIDGSDYTLIDNAFNTQGASLSTEIANSTGEIASPAVTIANPAYPLQDKSANHSVKREQHSKTAFVPAGILQTETQITFADTAGSNIETLLLQQDVLDELTHSNQA
jgi:hypothetical protein